MIICPNCKREQLTGTMFCGECGASLENADDSTTNTFDSPFDQLGLAAEEEQVRDVSPDAIVALFIPSFEACLNLYEMKTYTIGRVSDGQEILPGIDLTEYDAFQNGISRLHASLSIGNEGVFLLDLDSSNGTRLNGRRMMPHVPYPLGNGDLIVFGNLQARFVDRR